MKTFSGRAPSQNEYELRKFIDLLRERNVTRYLEIGARHGDTFYDVMCSLPAGSLGVAVDFPGGLWGTLKSMNALDRACVHLIEKGYRIKKILGNSTVPEIIDRVKCFGQFDAALIDGDHTYNGVKNDWKIYSPMASIVALHDIVGYGQCEKVHGNPVEVPRFWEEIKPSLGSYTEYIAEGSQMGIGVCLSR
jgi:cephalosporin hydroxylase